MAIGDTVANLVLVNSSITIQATYNCPNCGVANQTPQITKPIAGLGQYLTFFGSMLCVNCTKRLYFTILESGVAVSGIQVQV